MTKLAGQFASAHLPVTQSRLASSACVFVGCGVSALFLGSVFYYKLLAVTRNYLVMKFSVSE